MSSGVSSLAEAAAVLRPHRHVGLASRPIDLLPLLRAGMLDHLWSCEAADPDWGDEFATMLMSCEAQVGHRARWRTADLDMLLPYLDDCAPVAAGDSKLTLAPCALTTRWRSALRGHLGGLLTVPPLVASGFRSAYANKIVMRRWLRRLGVSVPPSIVVRRASLGYASIARHLGSSFVLQTPVGSAGRGTHRIQHEVDIIRACTEHPAVEQWLASSYVGDTTLNLHGLVTARGDVDVSRPSVQLTNLTQAGASFGEYCGNDFGAPNDLPSAALHHARRVTQLVGASLAGHGYRGIFGIDFAVCGDTVAALEVNARVQASTWLLGEIELAAGELPTLCRHVLELHGHPTNPPRRPEPQMAAYVVIRHTGPECTLLSAPEAGVYTWHGATLTRTRGGVGLAGPDTGQVTVSDVPCAGMVLHPGAVIGRLITPEPLTSRHGQNFDARGRQIVESFRKLFSTKRCGDRDTGLDNMNK